MKQIGRQALRKAGWLTAIVVCVAVMLVGLAPGVQAAVPEPGSQFYVLDQANVLDSSTENTIVSQNQTLYQQTGAQICVVTVDFLDGQAIDDYAYDLFNSWGIGDKDRNNGILILLAIGEDNYYVLQGTGLENTLTSGTIQNLLDTYMEPDFAAGQYDAAVQKTFAQLYDRWKVSMPVPISRKMSITMNTSMAMRATLA